MDFGQIPETEKVRLMTLIEEKQAKQYFKMYNFITRRCFSDCISANTMNTQVLTSREIDCIKNCTGKILRSTNKISNMMAEKQQALHQTSYTQDFSPED